MNYALSKEIISTPSYINLSHQTMILALYQCLSQTEVPWAWFGCTYAFSVELHWNMDFLPSFSFLKPQVVWGKLVLKIQREVGSRSEEQFPVARLCSGSAGICSSKAWPQWGNSIFCWNFIPLLCNCQSLPFLHCPLLLLQPKPSCGSQEAFPIEATQAF